MVNHAKSNALKAQLARKKQDDLMAQAVALFHDKNKAKMAQAKNACHGGGNPEAKGRRFQRGK